MVEDRSLSPEMEPCLTQALETFRLAFGAAGPPAWRFFVPGRLEVLGKHTDYAGGRSLLAATAAGLILVAAPNGTDRVRLVNAEARFDPAEFRLAPDLEVPIGPWTNYPMSVARRLARNFGAVWSLGGVDIAVASRLPAASGLSSSSALVVGSFLAMAAPHGLEECPLYRSEIHCPEDLATYLACHENGRDYGRLGGDRGVGTFGGSEDHTAMLCCRPGRLSVYRFCPSRLEQEIEFPDDLAFVVCHSGVHAEKTGSALVQYNAVSARAARACARYNAHYGTSHATLADLFRGADAAGSTQELLARFARVPEAVGPPEHLLDRVRQFALESEELIPRAAQAMARRDLAGFGTLVDTSQDLARRFLWNNVPETDWLQRTARELGALAASAFGAGFGGSVYAVIPRGEVEDFQRRWQEAYTARFPQAAAAARWLVTVPSGAAHRIPKD